MICLCLLVLYLYIHVCQHMSYQLILYDLLIFLCYCRHFVSDRLSDYSESRDQVQGAYKQRILPTAPCETSSVAGGSGGNVLHLTTRIKKN